MNDDILDFIYDARSEELAKLNEKDREFLNSPKVDFNKTYKNFVNSLGNLPDELKNTHSKYLVCYGFIFINLCFII